jgi:hypothetical protein
MAIVQTKEGKQKKILIEVQKSWDEDDVMRFRNYLAEQYKKVDKINGIDVILPITTIYIMGGKVSYIDTACLKVGKDYTDMVHDRKMEIDAPFVDKLTHNCYIIQTGRISDKRYSTRLDRLLSLFEQTDFVNEGSGVIKQYSYPCDDEDIQFITSLLHEMVADPKEREEIEKEEEALRILEDVFGKKNREQKQIIEEKNKIIEEKNKILEEKNKILEEKDKIIEALKKQLTENRNIDKQ